MYAVIAVGVAVWANKARQDADGAAKAATKSENRAIEARKKAEDRARIAESRRLAALSEAERRKRLDRAFILAVEAVGEQRTTEARNSLFRCFVARPGIVSFLHADEGSVESVAFSPDGKTLVAGYAVIGVSRGGVVLWDAQRRMRLQAAPLTVAEGDVNSVAFRTLAVGYADVGSGGVVLWDAQRRTRLQAEPLTAAKGLVGSVAFSPDGKTLAAGYASSGGGWVVLWDLDLESWKRLVGQIVNRNLSLDEWRRFFPDVTYRPTFPSLPTPKYDDHYKDIARNLTRSDWLRYFPNLPYRKTFENLAISRDPAPDDARASAVGAGDVPKKTLE